MANILVDKLNIRWGSAGFGRDDWRFIYRLVQKYNIRSVLEYGCGLSTELLYVIGLEVLSLETQERFAKLYKDFNVVLCDYDEGYPAFSRRFDLGFIDGPGEAERHDRSKSVLHAKQYCDYIYLHDYDLYQFEQFENDPAWIQCRPYKEAHNHFFIRKEVLL